MRKMMLSAVLVVVTTACASYHKEPARVQAPAAQQEPVSAKAQVAAIEASCVKSADAMKQRQAQKSLYLRLGGRDKINELSTRLYAAHAANKQIGHMFEHVDKGPFVEHVTNFLVANSGGGGTYDGRSMAQVHEHLNISYSDFLSAGGDVQSVMKGLGYGDEEIQEAVCFLVSFVPQVVKS
jgi:truncated hemoglobin YjbI